ncbi:unnamed protein product [Symbiodinium sp. KB8]|nr:unnamed protein product [Symbiodinium sp. KB8]
MPHRANRKFGNSCVSVPEKCSHGRCSSGQSSPASQLVMVLRFMWVMPLMQLEVDERLELRFWARALALHHVADSAGALSSRRFKQPSSRGSMRMARWHHLEDRVPGCPAWLAGTGYLGVLAEPGQSSILAQQAWSDDFASVLSHSAQGSGRARRSLQSHQDALASKRGRSSCCHRWSQVAGRGDP